MIRIEDSRTKVIYCRTNRRVKWTYSEYGGRYETEEEAIRTAKEHYGETGFEYRIENMETDEIKTGFVGALIE